MISWGGSIFQNQNKKLQQKSYQKGKFHEIYNKIFSHNFFMSSENQIENFSCENTTFSKKKIKIDKNKASDTYLKKWSVPENILYARYLKTHMGQMSNKKKKKCGKFIRMANFIGSKTQNQCRSHHQKMLLAFKSIQNIIRYVSEVRKLGQLISLEQYQKGFSQKLGLQSQTKGIQEIKEQFPLGRESQSVFNLQNEKRLNQQGRKSNDEKCNGVPIVQQESQLFMGRSDDGIFDVLNMDSQLKYEEFFLF